MNKVLSTGPGPNAEAWEGAIITLVTNSSPQHSSNIVNQTSRPAVQQPSKTETRPKSSAL